MAQQIVFRNLQLLDPRFDEVRGGYEVLIEGETIREVSARPIKAAGATPIDCGGKVLMPGLIDCHVHVFLVEVGIARLESMPMTLLSAKASVLMRQMLDRGFTTVRDTGGADWGIKEAVENGTLAGPRLFISAQAIGPTGGHTDARRRTQFGRGEQLGCHCCDALSFITGIADGVDGVRYAVREQMRQGADQIKIMLSGGVASPWDPLDSLQFSIPEICAAVEEAHAFGRYVCAHAYSPEAITRGVANGVRTIEHGNLIDGPSAKLMAEHKAFMVANLVTYYKMKEQGRTLGLSESQLEKNDLVIEGGLRSLEICKRAGVPVGFGTDLLGKLQVHQSEEFLYRSEVLSPLEIIRQATLVGAQIVRREGKLGVIEPGAFADFIVVDGNPLKDVGLFQNQGAHLSAIMKAGVFHKNAL